MARKWNPSYHPRDSKGRFTRSATRVMQPADRRRAADALKGFLPYPPTGTPSSYLAHLDPASKSHDAPVRGYFDGGWKDTNSLLRAGKTNESVAGIDKAMKPLPDDMMLRRQVPLSMFGHIPLPDLKGMKVRDAAYASTSLDHSGDSPDGMVTMHIAAPKGTRAILNPDGEEVLLDRDTEIAVTRVEPNGRGGWDVYGTVIPKAAARTGGKKVPGLSDTKQPATAADEEKPAAESSVRKADFARWQSAAKVPGTVMVDTESRRDMRIRDQEASIAQLIADRDRIAEAAGDQFDFDQRYNTRKPYGPRVVKKRRAEAISAATKEADEQIAYEQTFIEYLRNSTDPVFDERVGGRRVGSVEPDPSQPLAVYGDMLHIADESGVSHRHLTDIESVPVELHAVLRDHLAGSTFRPGGIYVGDSAVPFLDDLGHLANEQPRGWPPGSTWMSVPGAYSESGRVLALGGGGKGHGSTSLALHEFGHGLDAAMGAMLGANGSASQMANFREIHARIAADPGVNPYYSQPGDAGPSEAWAEGFAAWAKASKTRDDRAAVIAAALKVSADVGQALATYYDNLESARRSSRGAGAGVAAAVQPGIPLGVAEIVGADGDHRVADGPVGRLESSRDSDLVVADPFGLHRDQSYGDQPELAGVAAASTPEQPDYAQIQQQWVQAQQRLIQQWPQTAQPMVDELADQARAAVAAGELGMLGNLAVSAGVLAAVALVLGGVGTGLAAQAAAGVVAEAAAAGITLAAPVKAGAERVWQTADAFAGIIAAGYASGAARAALQAAGADPGTVRDAVAEHLAGIGDAGDRGFVADNLGAMLSAAQNAGRLAVLEKAKGAKFVAREVNDHNRCEPCQHIDGKIFSSLADAVKAYPTAGYKECKGGLRCRGGIFPVWD